MRKLRFYFNKEVCSVEKPYRYFDQSDAKRRAVEKSIPKTDFSTRLQLARNDILNPFQQSKRSTEYESAAEVYYNAQVTPWLSISPSVQYVTNPGGTGTAGDAVVLGVRAVIIF